MRRTAGPGKAASRWLICAALTGLVAACSPAPSAAPSVSNTGPLTAPTSEATTAPAASGAPSTSPAASVAPSPSFGVGTLDVFPPGAAVQVAVKSLNLRANHSTAAKRITTLSRGDVLIITPDDSLSFGFGPVSKGGYTWYPVMVTTFKNGTLPALPTSPTEQSQPATFGWIAADNGIRPYVTALAPRCPETVDLANVQGMLAAERLACFGGPITLSGTFGCGGCGGEVFGTYKPVWLATPVELDFLSVNPAERLGPIALRFPPDGPARPAPGTRVNVTVHVDDSRATKCTMVNGVASSAVTVNKSTAVLYCRERLVVDSLQNLGPDPSFPTP